MFIRFKIISLAVCVTEGYVSNYENNVLLSSA